MINPTLKEQLEALDLVPPASSHNNAHKGPRPAGMRKPSKPSMPNNKKEKPAWLEHAQYGVELLKAYFPACFKEMKDAQPLQIGIKQALVKRLSKEDIVLSDKACMVSSLSYYVSAVSYHKKMIEGTVRIDLEGNPTGIVTADEARYSAQCCQAKTEKNGRPRV